MEAMSFASSQTSLHLVVFIRCSLARSSEEEWLLSLLILQLVKYVFVPLLLTSTFVDSASDSMFIYVYLIF